MKKFKRHEIRAVNGRVLAKQYNEYNPEHFIWVEIAEFFFQPGVCNNPAEVAEVYVKSIIEDQFWMPDLSKA